MQRLAVASSLGLVLVQSRTLQLTAHYPGYSCVGPPAILEIEECTSCAVDTCFKSSSGGTKSVDCVQDSNYQSSVKDVFGNSAFIIQETYSDKNCTEFQSAKVVNVANSCVLDESTGMFIRGELKKGGAIVVKYFLESSCTAENLHHADYVTEEIVKEHSCDSNLLRWYVKVHSNRVLASTVAESSGDFDTFVAGDTTTSSLISDVEDNSSTGTGSNSGDTSADTTPNEDGENTSAESNTEDATDVSSSTGSSVATTAPTSTEVPATGSDSSSASLTTDESSNSETSAPTPTPTNAGHNMTSSSKSSSSSESTVNSGSSDEQSSSTSKTTLPPEANTSSSRKSAASSTGTVADAAVDDNDNSSGSSTPASAGKSIIGKSAVVGIVMGSVVLSIVVIAFITRRRRSRDDSIQTPVARDPYCGQTSPSNHRQHHRNNKTRSGNQQQFIAQQYNNSQPRYDNPQARLHQHSDQGPSQQRFSSHQTNQYQPCQPRSIQYPYDVEQQSSNTHTAAFLGINSSSNSQNELWNDSIITTKRIPKDKVQVHELLSCGAFGKVYSGFYNKRIVAVKILLPQILYDMSQVNEFLSEAKLHATTEHPHIVSFIGIAWDSLSDVCVVTEYMDGGDLRSLLNDYEATRHPVGFDHEKVMIALHVCQALAYMHSLTEPVLHRDLKSRNILLNQAMEAKLADFGISKKRLDQAMIAGVGTSLWIAPEVLMGNKYDDKADVFSFGVVLSELDIHLLPYSNAMASDPSNQWDVILQKVSTGALQVEFSQNGPGSMKELGTSCVAVDPSKRPTTAEVLYRLETILKWEMA